MERNFKRTIEDFVCEHCDTKVAGDGYTNHCPQCLHSKHVDINPGDRASMCGGLMVPVSYEKRGSEYYILTRCDTCKHEKNNKFGPSDNFEALRQL